MNDIQRISSPHRLIERLSGAGETAPAKLWVRGNSSLPSDPHSPRIAVVGSRTCSRYGENTAYAWAYKLALEGYVIVSGLARGIDGAAHKGALASGKQGSTIGVLGCGIDRIYPAAHGELAKRIIDQGGSIVSEYEAGIQPSPWRFPARNRIVAGLVDAVIVIEARVNSGSLITVDFALGMGVPVFAIPGDISSELSRGANDLIRTHKAELVTDPQQVIEQL